MYISQADRAGLEKAPRWAKIWSKTFQTKTCLGFVILSLSVSLSLSLSVFLSVCLTHVIAYSRKITKTVSIIHSF